MHTNAVMTCTFFVFLKAGVEANPAGESWQLVARPDSLLLPQLPFDHFNPSAPSSQLFYRSCSSSLYPLFWRAMQCGLW